MSTSRSGPRHRHVGFRLPAGLLPVIAVALIVTGCATGPSPETQGKATWAGKPIGPPPAPNPSVRRAIIARANGEWDYFGRQTVVFRGSDESIPHVGDWEDDDPRHSRRVNAYWRAVGHPEIDGMDCDKPWSAAFISWVMQHAGVPEYQFQPAIAHWVYLSRAIDDAPLPARWFVPRRVEDYSPRPGDLICSSRGPRRVRTFGGYTTPAMLRNTSTHCDLVIAVEGRRLQAIGGNVRNSVSMISVELDAKGRLRDVPRRPWFMILENRL
jgi:hypothetical protein